MREHSRTVPLDTLGSVVSSFNNLPNGAAVVLGDQVYGPYGNRRVQQGTISTSKGFTGQFTDFVAGLDYYAHVMRNEIAASKQ